MEFKVVRMWSPESVHDMCVKFNLYTLGSNEEYSGMLNTVKLCEPCYDVMRDIAQDIFRHSVPLWNIYIIMYLLEEEAVTVVFRLVDR